METKTSEEEKLKVEQKNSKHIAAIWKSPTMRRRAVLEFSGFDSWEVRYRLFPGSWIILIE